MANRGTVVKIDDREWHRFLSTLTQRMQEALGKLKALAATQGLRNIKEHFEQEQSPEGRWKRWSPRYAKYASKRGQTKVLQNTGKLKGSILPSTIKKAPDGILIFSNAAYAAKHNYGLKGLPKREFMWLSDKTIDLMAQSLLKWMTK